MIKLSGKLALSNGEELSPVKYLNIRPKTMNFISLETQSALQESGFTKTTQKTVSNCEAPRNCHPPTLHHYEDS